MKLRTKRCTLMGERVPLVALDESLHRAVFEPETAPAPQREPIAGMVTIPGTKLTVVREWAVAMGYLPPEEEHISSSGDGSHD